MAPTNFGYSLREAGSHFFRNLGTSLGAVITIFLSLFIIGLFIVGSAMVNSLIGTVEQQVTIQAFIADDASDEAIESFQDKLEGWDNVKSVTFKTKEDALKDYKDNISNNADATLAALDGENPLPRSFVIEMDEPSQVESTAAKIKSDSDFREIVDDSNANEENVDADVEAGVLYGQKEVARLFEFTSYVRIGAVVLVALLTFIAFIFINNTIRLSITARRREIAIMRLVGASNSFIRGPFLMEGILQAMVGFLIALGVLEALHWTVMPQVTSALTFLNLSIAPTVYVWVYLLLLVLAVLIGVLGSILAMRRYLKV